MCGLFSPAEQNTYVSATLGFTSGKKRRINLQPKTQSMDDSLPANESIQSQFTFSLELTDSHLTIEPTHRCRTPWGSVWPWKGMYVPSYCLFGHTTRFMYYSWRENVFFFYMLSEMVCDVTSVFCVLILCVCSMIT